jgi:hypothetical protein
MGSVRGRANQFLEFYDHLIDTKFYLITARAMVQKDIHCENCFLEEVES